MSQAESQSDSEDVQSGEASSGIVITNGPDGVGEDKPSPEAEAESEPEIDADAEAEADAGVEETADNESEVTPEVDDGGESEPANEAEPEVEEDEEASNEAEPEAEEDEEASDEAEPEAEPETNGGDEPDINEDADGGESGGGTTETDTEVEPETEGEEDESEDVSEPEVDGNAEEAADATNTDEDSNTTMSESEAEATTQSTDTESGSTDLADVSGAPTQFEATIEADSLQGLIDSVDVLVDECKVRLGDDRVGIRAVDPANVGMVDVELEAEAFESYHTTPGLLGLNLERFADVVSLADKGDLVHLNFDPQTRKLHINVGGIEYTLALIDPDSIRQEPDIPDLDLAVEVSVQSGVVDQAVTAADMVSDHIALGTQQDGRINQLVIEAEGDTDDVELVKGEDEEEIIDGTFNGAAHSLFSLDYLKDMNKALPKDGVVTLELGQEFPVKVHFDDEDEQMHTTYMLAPRIQSD